MAPAAQFVSNTCLNMDEVDIDDLDDLCMEADALGADTKGDASLPHLPQQVPTATSLPVLEQTGSVQLDIRRHSPTPDSIHQNTSSSVQARRAGEKRKVRRESPSSQAGVSDISPALSQTRHGRPARKRRMCHRLFSQRLPPASTQLFLTLLASDLQRGRSWPSPQAPARKKVADATPARKHVVKHAARPALPVPELSQNEIAQAKADGIVWARIGSYEAWPAQVGPTLPAPVYID